ncbi:hypothetical protein PIB30_048797 [Stylosanthes scabra]|uniref:Uncharacterized protein n=1 Tax=Stylosanthes scabra TaxID=79078 RepID=A0ABU6WI72_9FABA|nr:hypothetical protein [Stylosanthes scabra]
MIETVADANQHFSTRAKNRGVNELATSESIMLAKTLAKVVAILKEIKEGQQAYTATLKQNSNNSYVKPTRHCGICSCDSHYTDECPLLQDDNMVAATKDFFEPTVNPPYNSNTVTKAGEIISPFVETHLRNSKANSGNPIPTLNLRITRMFDINHHTTVSSLIHLIILHSALKKPCAFTRRKTKKLRKYRKE